jgi:alpha-beta hydrolase superfamily lysophospholipase
MDHSMGGLAVVAMAIDQSPELTDVSGLILLAPWLSSMPGRLVHGSWTMGLARSVAWLWAGFVIPTGLHPDTWSYAQEYKDLVLKSRRLITTATVPLMDSVISWLANAQDVTKIPEIAVLFVQGMRDPCVIKEFDVEFHDLLKADTRKESFEEILRFCASCGAET